MARATRSSALHEKDKPPEPAPPPRKAASKKRKRTSLSDANDQPATKQQRTEDEIKDDPASQELDPSSPLNPPSSAPDLPSTGDVPIESQYAAKILDILEGVDTQGLLDRVFPLPTEQEDASSASSSAGSSSSSRVISFRTLLKSSEQYPLRVLRSAIQHLFPISSHPRSRPSATAAEQLRFCNLALSLLNQASQSSTVAPLDVDSLIASLVSDPSEESSSPKQPATRRRKYALVQKLPSGDWWTSTNSTPPLASDDGKDITDLSTGFADLVAIFPTPSSANLKHGKTLGEYAQKRTFALPKPPKPRQICTGAFLDYGPYASFAPTFDQTGMEIGRVTMGEVLYQQEKKRRLKALQDKVRMKQAATRAAQAKEDGPRSTGQPPGINGDAEVEKSGLKSLEGLLSEEQISSLKSSLESLELEASVDELLTRNAKALRRLEELQEERLEKRTGAVSVDSEEWDTAQNILESLAVLASLRPKLSPGDSDHSPLIPTPSALRKLHRTLPIGDTGGWFGTLPERRASALHDDMTVRLKAGVVAPAPVPVATPSTPAPPPKASTPVAAAQPSNYNYSNYNSQYRSGYGSYNLNQPTATTSYYSQTSAAHYPNAQYQGTSQQQYYSTSGFYNYQAPTGSGASSGRGTPQPIPGTSTIPTGQYTFLNNTPQQQAQRAVANTVVTAGANKTHPQQQQQQGTWPNGSAAAAGSAPTLPPHLRGTQGGTAGTYQQGYYQNAQATPTQMR